LEHAITIADKAKADILMVWAKKPDNTKDIFSILPENLFEEVKKRFEELIKKYKIGFKNGKLEYKIREGKIYKEIVKEAEESGAFLIVTGTHGASGFEKFWAGSNANKVVSASKLPVITIRGGIDIDRKLSKIVMPIDSSLETRQKVSFTSILAKLFNAEIYVLAVYTTNIKAVQSRVDRYANQITEHLEEEGIKYHLDSIRTDNLTNATIEYAEKIDANLISIMTEQEKTTANLWLGPYAAQMVNHSPIPVLSIHSKQMSISLAR
jgi:nucleotide-binding universal stress UspA family protein